MKKWYTPKELAWAIDYLTRPVARRWGQCAYYQALELGNTHQEARIAAGNYIYDLALNAQARAEEDQYYTTN